MSTLPPDINTTFIRTFQPLHLHLEGFQTERCVLRFCNFFLDLAFLEYDQRSVIIKMSRPHDGQRHLFPFGNPLRGLFPKQSYLPPWLHALLNKFEESLAGRLKKLKPNDKGDVVSFSWMRLAMESLCETHTDIQSFIRDLEYPVSAWDQKLMDVYLDNSVRLLDICIALNSELSRLSQGQLLLQCILHVLDVSSSDPSSEKLAKAHASLGEWRRHLNSSNPKLQNCSEILNDLAGSLHLPKAKSSAKRKVLMRALRGVKVHTLFVCSVFTAAFSGSVDMLVDLHVSDKLIWAEAFNDLRSYVNEEIRRTFAYGNTTILKELEAVDSSVKALYPMVSDRGRTAEVEQLKTFALELSKNTDKLSQGLDLLSKQVEGFFQIVLSGRDALLCNLRDSDCNSDQRKENGVQVAR